jgi:hypothetical protein
VESKCIKRKLMVMVTLPHHMVIAPLDLDELCIECNGPLRWCGGLVVGRASCCGVYCGGGAGKATDGESDARKDGVWGWGVKPVNDLRLQHSDLWQYRHLLTAT